jgi:hypothetical protein
VLGLDKKTEQLCLYERGTDGKHTAISKRSRSKPFVDIMRLVDRRLRRRRQERRSVRGRASQ